MKMFTKLALVSSMAIVSVNAMAALVANTDAQDAAVTGQDGINIGIGISKIEIAKVLVHDNNGLVYSGTAPTAGQAGYGGTGNAGAIVIKGDGDLGADNAVGGTGVNADSVTATNGIVITTNAAALLPSDNLADIVIDTDAGTGTNGAFLNVAAEVSGLNIAIGEIGVSASNAMPGSSATSIRRGAKDTGSGSNYNAILSGLKITTGTMDANIQLGAAPQGAMIVLNTSMTGGLEITDLGILDNSTKLGTGATTGSGNRAAGEIRLDSIKVADANGADLTVNAKVNVIGESDAGKGYLKISAMDTASDIYIKGVHLGSATAGSIGDVEVQGMQTYYSPSAGVYTKGAVITISGH